MTMFRIISGSILLLGFVLPAIVSGAPQKYSAPSKSMQRYQKPGITKYQKPGIPKYHKPR